MKTRSTIDLDPPTAPNHRAQDISTELNLFVSESLSRMFSQSDMQIRFNVVDRIAHGVNEQSQRLRDSGLLLARAFLTSAKIEDFHQVGRLSEEALTDYVIATGFAEDPYARPGAFD